MKLKDTKEEMARAVQSTAPRCWWGGRARVRSPWEKACRIVVKALDEIAKQFVVDAKEASKRW